MTRSLTLDEQKTFDAEYARLMSLLTMEREINPFAGFAAWVASAIATQADALQTSFGGARPTPDQLGWRAIRPEDVNPDRVAAQLRRVDWTVTAPQNAGWTDYIPNIGGPPSNLLRVDERSLMMIMGYAALSEDPHITAARVIMSQQPQTVDYFEDQVRLSDVPMFPMVVPIVLTGGVEYNLRVKFDALPQPGQGTEELQLLGLILQRGSEMTKEVPDVIV